MKRALVRLLVVGAAGVGAITVLRRTVRGGGGVAGIRTGSLDVWPPVPPAPAHQNR